MRLIEEFFRVLKRIIELRESGEGQEALKEIDAAAMKYVGIDPRVIDASPAEGILSLLSVRARDFDARKCALLALLLREKGAVYEDVEDVYKSYWNYSRSLFLMAHAMTVDESLRTDEGRKDVNELVGKLAKFDLSVELKVKMFRYYEAMGEYGKAENILFDLIDRQPASPWRNEALLFYSRLEALSDSELEAGGLPREEISEGRITLSNRKPR